MNPVVTFENLVSMTSPFRKRRHIFFNEDSIAYELYGGKVYGRIMPNKAYNHPETIRVEDQFLKIDAQVINGHNTHLGNLRMDLFYKGVHFSQIDIAKSFPEADSEI